MTLYNLYIIRSPNSLTSRPPKKVMCQPWPRWKYLQGWERILNHVVATPAQTIVPAPHKLKQLFLLKTFCIARDMLGKKVNNFSCYNIWLQKVKCFVHRILLTESLLCNEVIDFFLFYKYPSILLNLTLVGKVHFIISSWKVTIV